MQFEQIMEIGDKNKDGLLGLDEIHSLFKKINLNMSKSALKQLLEKYNSSGVTKQEFQQLYQQISKSKSLEMLYKIYSGTKSDWFIDFMTNVQLDNSVIINEFSNVHSFKDFETYFSNPKNHAYSFEKKQPFMDMKQNWANYFMNSSHNTYLVGNQLSSESSLDGYIRALEQGCRCVELDCWDGPDNEPIITHGFTLTSKIYFKDVVQIIHKYAFVASPYPIVLSLEVHCSPKQQDRMASILIQVLGETLVTSRFPAGVTVSPESLKNRILIKGRALAEQDASSNDIEDESDMSQTEEEPGVKDATNPKNIQMSPKLAALVVYQQSKKMKTVSESNTFKNHHVSSLSESKASKMITTSGMEEFINFTRNAFARIFPLGGRVDSSNLDPIPYWQVGCQMVALNYQNFDKSMQLNRGFFLQNNNFGYLLKPTLSVKPVVKVNLSITVLSAFYLPKPQNELKGEIVDPFVVVEFLSCSERGGKTKSNVFKSEFITDNGFNPVWNDIPMTGDPVPNLIVDETICNPEISFVTFTIFDEDLMKKDFLAAASIPYDCLRTGYRFVNLYDYHGKLLPFSHLLVYIKK